MTNDSLLARRRGLSLLEMTVALFLLTTAMVAIVQLLTAAAGQRRTTEQRRLALEEIANQAERVALLSWEQTAADKLTSWQPSAELAALAPEATCSVEVEEEEGPPISRRMRLMVAWPDAVGQPIAVAVTTWKFAPEERP